MSEFANCVTAMLRVSPGGLTAKDIAERLGTTAGNISSRLSKLAAYGIIGKAREASVLRGLRGTVYQALSDDPRHPKRFLHPGLPLIGRGLRSNP
jgi:DNA-binding transcriptional regulator GbsR (MarR family)